MTTRPNTPSTLYESDSQKIKNFGSLIARILIFFILTTLSLCKVSGDVHKKIENTFIKEDIKEDIH
jgi:hypothetical protein